jgi:hypothetical protein
MIDNLGEYLAASFWLLVIALVVSLVVFYFKKSTTIGTFTYLNKNEIQDIGISIASIMFVLLSLSYFFLERIGMVKGVLLVLVFFVLILLVQSNKIANNLCYPNWTVVTLNLTFPILFVGFVMSLISPENIDKLWWTVFFFFFYCLGHVLFFLWLSFQKNLFILNTDKQSILKTNDKFLRMKKDIERTLELGKNTNKQMVIEEVSELKDKYVDEISDLLYLGGIDRLEEQRGVLKDDSINVQTSHLHDLKENNFNLKVETVKIL